MKKISFYSLALVLSVAVLSFASCSDDDTTGPVISLNGSNPMVISLNSTATDPGATADDEEDGTVAVSSDWTSTNPNVNVKGTYTVTYTAQDAAGNVSTETRTVNVVNDADFLAGAYINVYDSCQLSGTGTFNANISTSNTVNNAFSISNFGGFGTTININGTLNGTTLNFPGSQTLGATSSLISASGTVTSTGSPVIFAVQYTWTDGTQTEVCASLYQK